MNLPFDLNTFLHCPQGPRLEGEARANACRVLGSAIKKGQVMTAARLLMQDPSLITESIDDYKDEYKNGPRPVVQMAIDAGLDVFVLFALEHGMSVSSPDFGAPRGLLKVAIEQNSPDLTSYALLYRADPNQLSDDCNKYSFLDNVIDTAFVGRTGFRVINAFRIAHMLLDAGANPLLPGGSNTAIRDLCYKPWDEKDIEWRRIFTEIMKRTIGESERGNIGNGRLSFINFDRLAQNRQPSKFFLQTAKFLITAGFPFSTGELNAALDNYYLSKHIPTFAALIAQQRSRAATNATPRTPSGQAPPSNLAPEGFLTSKQDQRLSGVARKDGCNLLNVAIMQGRFITAASLLALDPSLITEQLGEEGQERKSAVQVAIESGMRAFVPFALMQGISADAPVFGEQRGLLEIGVYNNDRAMASYALLHQADPNQLHVHTAGDLPGKWTFLDLVFNISKKWTFLDLGYGTMDSEIYISAMLVDAGASVCVPGAVNTALADICELDWGGGMFDFKDIFAEMIAIAGVDVQFDNKPILRIAAEKRNIPAVRHLIAAGANTDQGFLGVNLFKLINDNGMEEHLPALTELVIRRKIGQGAGAVLDPTVKVVAAQGEPDAPEAGPRRLTSRDIF